MYHGVFLKERYKNRLSACFQSVNGLPCNDIHIALILGAKTSYLLFVMSTFESHENSALSFTMSSIIGGSCHKYHFLSRQTSLLSGQKYACRDKHIFVVTNNIVATSLLVSRQTRVCRDKTRLLSRQKYAYIVTLLHCYKSMLTLLHCYNTCLSRQNTYFFATKHVYCRDKSMLTLLQAYVCRDKHDFVPTKVLSRQAYFCRHKRRVLSRQKSYLWLLPPIIDCDYK